jgi:hypothetical protein
MKAIRNANALDTMRIPANANANETMLQLPEQDTSSELRTVISTMFRCLMMEQKINIFSRIVPLKPG